MPLQDKYITADVFAHRQRTGRCYEGFVIGEGYAWYKTELLNPCNRRALGSNQPIEHRNSSTLVRVQHLNTSPEMIERSLRFNNELEGERIRRELSARLRAYYDNRIWGMRGATSLTEANRLQLEADKLRAERDALLRWISNSQPIGLNEFPRSFTAFNAENIQLVREYIAMHPKEIRYQGTIRCQDRLDRERDRAIAMQDPIRRDTMFSPAWRSMAVGGIVVTAGAAIPVAARAGVNAARQAITRYTPTAINMIGRAVPYYHNAVLQVYGVAVGGVGLHIATGIAEGVIKELIYAPANAPSWLPHPVHIISSGATRGGINIIQSWNTNVQEKREY